MRTDSRRSRIPAFHVMDVWKAAAERARTHGDVLTLAAGQPSTPAPAPVLRAAREAIDTQVLGYTETFGTAELREAIAGYHRTRSGIEVDPHNVVVTTGSSGAFTLLFLAAFDLGDTVVVARPGYPAYRNTLTALGCRVIELDCGPATRYQPTVAMLDEMDEVPAGLIVASPANPTGTVIDPAELAALARWCEDHGTLLISDEIYHGIEFGTAEGGIEFDTAEGGIEFGTAEGSIGLSGPVEAGTPVPTACAWQTSREAVVIGSVSKYFSMTGWRLGWALVPDAMLRPLQRLSSNMTVCPPAISQYAAVAAFTEESRTELDAHVRRYAVNRALLLSELPRLGITELAPADGAFYVYAGIGHLTDDSTSWCADLLDATGVAVAPGIDFDTVHGHRTLRLSFAGSTSDIEEALARLEHAEAFRSRR